MKQNVARNWLVPLFISRSVTSETSVTPSAPGKWLWREFYGRFWSNLDGRFVGPSLRGWRMTCNGNGRQLLMEADIWWKTTFDWRQPLMEDDLWWKMTFNGRGSLLKDNPNEENLNPPPHTGLWTLGRGYLSPKFGKFENWLKVTMFDV